MHSLPIDDVLGDIIDRLRETPNLVIIAPPGAGKTTRVPGALVDSGIVGSKEQVWVLEPRRLAARLAAKRIAFERKSRIGDEVGYQVRFDDRTSKKTRIALLTEGILTRRLQSDPTLEDVGAVILDEFHERSIHADLAIAFLREIQETVRPELRLVVMSATIDPGPVTRYLDNCSVVKSEGRLHPVTVNYLEQRDERPLVQRVTTGVRRALKETEGDLLVFLPGAGEIRSTQRTLEEYLPEIDLLPLYGELSVKEQDRAVEQSKRRKVILSTNIAESSLTIEGVTVVVDAGLQKIARHDPARGVDRLDLVRICQRSADQRAGRAGRLRPGSAYRLWTAKEQRTLQTDEQPEIARVDLAAVLLEVIRWSAKDPRTFPWFEAPKEAMIARAEQLLRLFGALEGHTLTGLGERLCSFPVHPRLAMILVRAAEQGVIGEGALIAALTAERDIFRRTGRGVDTIGTCDLLERRDRIEELERMGMHRSAAERLGIDLFATKNVLRVRDRLAAIARRLPVKKRKEGTDDRLRQLVLAGYPDRVGKRIKDRITLVGGTSLHLSPESVVKDSAFLVAVDVGGGDQRREGRVHIASQVERTWLEETAAYTTKTVARFNKQKESVEVVEERRYHDLLLDEARTNDQSVDTEEVLARAAQENIDRALPLTKEVEAFLLRLRFLGEAMPELSFDPPLEDWREQVVADLCLGKRSFEELRKIDLVSVLNNTLPSEVQRALAVDAPEQIPIPSGRSAKLRYEHDGPPALSVRLQEVFGLYETPRVARGRVPVKMELLAPNMRPVQVTQDLASFWERTYQEVRKELRRRYPKHQWPEDPRKGIPSTRVRPRKR